MPRHAGGGRRPDPSEEREQPLLFIRDGSENEHQGLLPRILERVPSTGRVVPDMARPDRNLFGAAVLVHLNYALTGEEVCDLLGLFVPMHRERTANAHPILGETG